MRALIIDDYADLALYEAMSLRSQGHKVHVISGDFGILLHDSYPWDQFDVAVVDLLLSDALTDGAMIDGAKILEHLATCHPHVRRVVASGVVPVPERIQMLADVVLSKPFSPERLLRAVEGDLESNLNNTGDAVARD